MRVDNFSLLRRWDNRYDGLRLITATLFVLYLRYTVADGSRAQKAEAASRARYHFHGSNRRHRDLSIPLASEARA